MLLYLFPKSVFLGSALRDLRNDFFYYFLVLSDFVFLVIYSLSFSDRLHSFCQSQDSFSFD